MELIPIAGFIMFAISLFLIYRIHKNSYNIYIDDLGPIVLLDILGFGYCYMEMRALDPVANVCLLAIIIIQIIFCSRLHTLNNELKDQN